MLDLVWHPESGWWRSSRAVFLNEKKYCRHTASKPTSDTLSVLLTRYHYAPTRFSENLSGRIRHGPVHHLGTHLQEIELACFLACPRRVCYDIKRFQSLPHTALDDGLVEFNGRTFPNVGGTWSGALVLQLTHCLQRTQLDVEDESNAPSPETLALRK